METITEIRRVVLRLALFAAMFVLPMFVVYQSPTWIRQAMGLPTGNHLLEDAAIAGDVRRIQEALANGAAVDATDDAGYTPLQCAIMASQRDSVVALISGGASVSTTTSIGCTPLLLALSGRHTDLIPLLIRAGADPNQPNETGTSPLCIACMDGDMKAIEMLLHAGADVNARSPSGVTPALAASFTDEDRTAVFRRLIRAGADLNLADTEGETPLMQAAARGDRELISMLLIGGADPARLNLHGETARTIALRNQNWNVVPLLDVQRRSPSRRSLFSFVVEPWGEKSGPRPSQQG